MSIMLIRVHLFCFPLIFFSNILNMVVWNWFFTILSTFITCLILLIIIIIIWDYYAIWILKPMNSLFETPSCGYCLQIYFRMVTTGQNFYHFSKAYKMKLIFKYVSATQILWILVSNLCTYWFVIGNSTETSSTSSYFVKVQGHLTICCLSPSAKRNGFMMQGQHVMV